MRLLISALYTGIMERTIRTIVKYPDKMVAVFGANGQPLPECENLYDSVKGRLIEKAPPEARFYHAFRSSPFLRIVKREEW